MERFDDLLSKYLEGSLGAEDRRELGSLIEADPDCLEAFLDAVSELRIRRLELQKA